MYTVNQRLVGVVTPETCSDHIICVYTEYQSLVGVVTSETCSDHIICGYTVNQSLVGVGTSETCSDHIICVCTVNQWAQVPSSTPKAVVSIVNYTVNTYEEHAYRGHLALRETHSRSLREN